MGLDFLGQAQVINSDTDNKSILRDPFSCSLHDFISFSLNELSKALHIVIAHTYDNLIEPKHKKYFYLTGYKPRHGWNTLQQKIYGNPHDVAGQSIKWQLKNLRWHYKKYLKYFSIDRETLEDITGFLLFDIVLATFTSDEEIEYYSTDDCLTLDCFNASIDLLSTIIESTFYGKVKDDIVKIKQNIENMLPILLEFKAFTDNRNSKETCNLETKRVIEFFKSDALLSGLQKESQISSNSPISKPLTNYFLYTVMPRFEKLSLNSDSGVYVDPVIEEDSINESIVVIATPAAISKKSRKDDSIKEKQKKFQSKPNIKERLVIAATSKEKSKVNTSTPINNKKNIDLKKSPKMKPVKSYSNTKSRTGDEMDGSFVLI